MTTIHDELFGLNFCPACGKEAKKAVAHCVSCGVDFSSVLRVLDDSTPDPVETGILRLREAEYKMLEERVETLETRMLGLLAKLIEMGVDIR